MQGDRPKCSENVTHVTLKALKTRDFRGYCDRQIQAPPEPNTNEGAPASTYVGKFGAAPAGTGRGS